MNPETQHPEMTADESAAALANATHIAEQLQASQNPDSQPQDASGQEMGQKTSQDSAGMEKRLTGEIDALRTEISGNTGGMQKEVEAIRTELEQLLKEDGQEG